MQTPVDIRFRKERLGPELDLVNKFLKIYKELFDNQGFEITPLKEPYAEAGIPDVLLIVWDKNLCKTWQPQRDRLTKNDIKIIHYISTFGKKGVTINKIHNVLNFSEKSMAESLDRLSEADLLNRTDKKVYVKDLEKKFFIKKIISIEAKIDNWRSAINQAQLNENFCSHSYVLLPAEKINNSVLSSFKGKTGLLVHDGIKTILKKKAQKNKIPGSYFSWVINEYLGRQYAQSITSL